MKRFFLVPIFVGMFIAGCQVRELPGPNKLEPCIPMTGERDYVVEIIERPPENLIIGREFHIRFTGGYYDVFPSCEKTGNSMVYHYPTVDDLRSRSRNVEIFINNYLVHSQVCSYDCDITFALPGEIETGTYPLTVRPDSWLYQPRDMEFVVDVGRQ